MMHLFETPCTALNDQKEVWLPCNRLLSGHSKLEIEGGPTWKYLYDEKKIYSTGSFHAFDFMLMGQIDFVFLWTPPEPMNIFVGYTIT